MNEHDRGPRDHRGRAPAKRPINIQDSFVFGALKEGKELVFALVTGKQIKGQIRRFDRYAVVVHTGSQEILIYKHALVGITAMAPNP